MNEINWEEVTKEATEYLGQLIKINTTNPPGNEIEAAKIVEKILAREGFDALILESEPGRANLITRLKGHPQSEKKPFLLMSHLDVVPANPDEWDEPPFSGKIKDGYIWGRGALDCKGVAVAHLMVFLLLKKYDISLNRDIIFLTAADEENLGIKGIEWLVKNHYDLIEAEFAINEGGGISIQRGKRNIFLCQTAEKGVNWVKLTARGEASHGSIPLPDSAMKRMMGALNTIASYKSEYRKTMTAERMLKKVLEIGGVIFPSLLTKILTRPAVGNFLISLIRDDELRSMLWALFHNTISANIIRGGDKINVIPSEVTAEIDCRTIPGLSREEVLDEIKEVVNDYNIEISPIYYSKGAEAEIDTELYQAIEKCLDKSIPGSKLVPFIMPGATDGRFLIEKGCPTYGFFPLPPKKIDELREMSKIVHGANERISIEGLKFAIKTLHQIVLEFCTDNHL